jgi:signal peptidase II
VHQLPAGERAKEQTLTALRPIALHARPWLIAGLTLGADQLTKLLIRTSFAPGQTVPVLNPLLSLTYVQNTGAAFGLLKGAQGLFILCSLAVIGWIVRELARRPGRRGPVMWGCALILGGACGNLIDRLRFGYVVDFLDLHVWPVFNIGDSAITVGVALLIWRAVFAEKQRRSSSKQ